MARGQDTSRDLSRQIKREAQTQKYLFGAVVGTQDDGMRTLKRPAPAGGAEGSRPVFHGAAPNAIKLAQMQENHRQAMAGLMEPPPDNDRKVEGLVDLGMGRLSDGRTRPVQSWVDETIKIKKDDKDD